ncbi:hypothetical protein MU1_07510 [Paenibacillus glycanilyticus]|uniref:Transposase n=1 Tax=Paenibacillus glycanilyticus TaxID=126569 RepID=A0ABQ6G9P8_9BACL|nr:hypothetical protein MU1_07510 [Paenibacillus glycanilyticus]
MYKEYNIDQLSLPMDLQEDIPENHLVRVINNAVNRSHSASTPLAKLPTPYVRISCSCSWLLGNVQISVPLTVSVLIA